MLGIKNLGTLLAMISGLMLIGNGLTSKTYFWIALKVALLLVSILLSLAVLYLVGQKTKSKAAAGIAAAGTMLVCLIALGASL